MGILAAPSDLCSDFCKENEMLLFRAYPLCGIRMRPIFGGLRQADMLV